MAIRHYSRNNYLTETLSMSEWGPYGTCGIMQTLPNEFWYQKYRQCDADHASGFTSSIPVSASVTFPIIQGPSHASATESIIQWASMAGYKLPQRTTG